MDNKNNIKPEFFKDPLTWMVYHSVSANLMMVILLVIGFVLMMQIKKEVFPKFDLDTISIAVSYSGASVDNMENAIAIPIENAIANVDGIGDITTKIKDGSVSVDVEILNSSDIDYIYRTIQSDVNAISTFPSDMSPPDVSVARVDAPVMQLTLYGDADPNSFKAAVDLVKNVFAQNIDAGSLTFLPDLNYELRVEVSENTLRKYNLTIQQIGQIIAASGADVSAGKIKNNKENIEVRFNYKKYNANEFGNIVVLTTSTGSPVYLKDIATISNAFDENTDFDVSNDNKPAVYITVLAKSGQTPQSVSKAVNESIKKVNELLPQGITLMVSNDASKTFDSRAKILIKEGAIGVILVIIVLSLFLDLRLAFWTSWGIPISFLGSFFLLYATMNYTGFTVNVISMFAFIIVLGIVVDDAIVVGENVYSTKARYPNLPSKLATAMGVKEVSSSVFFSIFTNIISFLPLAFLPGIFGKIMKPIPLVIICVLLVSLFESLFILPARISFKSITSKTISPWLRYNPLYIFKKSFNKYFDIIVKYYYIKLLRKIINYRYFVLSIIVAILIVFIAYISSGRVGFVLMQQAEGDVVTLDVTFPYSSTLQTKVNMRKYLVDKAITIGEKYGGEGKAYKSIEADIIDNELHIRVFLPDENKIIGAFSFLDQWEASVPQFIGVTSYNFSGSAGSPGGEANISLNVSSTGSYNSLLKAINELTNKLSAYPFVTYVTTDKDSSSKEYNFSLNDFGYALGLTPSEVSNQVKNALYGYRALQQVKSHNIQNVVIRLPDNEINSQNDIRNIIIKTPSGNDVPLYDIVDLEQTNSTPYIKRINFQRSIKLMAFVNPDTESSKILGKFLSTDFKQVAEKYKGLTYSFGGRQKILGETGNYIIIGFILTLITIYTALAMFFNSYIQPVIIMIAIPFGFIGAFIGNLLMSMPISMPSLFGFLALSGVVVNASMIIIYFSNLRNEGTCSGVKMAIIHVSKRRFRPILLTSLTTFFGMLPTIISTASEVAFLRPIAVALGFGVIIATIITLLCMPVFYIIVDDIKNIFIKTTNNV